ncbi:MAG: metallophosphoesterase [Clostridiales bacterium]|jgi:hypothetical protein|nr:metallophosphoesterase [Clostridiales bacterium]
MSGKKKTNGTVGPLRVIGGFFAVLIALLAVGAAVVFYSFKVGYVFIDQYTFIGLGTIVFYAMVANAVYTVGVAVATVMKRRIPKAVIGVSVFSFILTLLFWVVVYVASDRAHFATAYIIGGATLPFLAALFGIPFFLLAFPNLKISVKARNVIALVLSVIFVGTISAAALFKFPPITFEFTSDPVVLDIGNDKYSVVFATNALSQGFVEYETAGGEKGTVYAVENGYKAQGKIHAVKLPREKLDKGGKYKVGSTRVLDRVAHGGDLGKTIKSIEYTFKSDSTTTDQHILAASDWHEEMVLLGQAASMFGGRADLALFMGDYADFYVNEDQIVEYILKGAHAMTKGEIPGIFVRGNHEVRADEKIEDLGLKFGLDKLYYQVKRGNNLFTIFDTAESEDGDQWEHDGFYDMLPYFNEELEWFENVVENYENDPDPCKTSVNNIILMHDRDFTGEQDDEHRQVVDRFKALTARFDVDFSVHGHSHGWGHHYETLNIAYNSAVDPDKVVYTYAGGSKGFSYVRFDDGGKGTKPGYSNKTLLDIDLLKDVKPKLPQVVQMILGLVVLEHAPQSYPLTLLTIDDAGKEVVYEKANEDGIVKAYDENGKEIVFKSKLSN